MYNTYDSFSKSILNKIDINFSVANRAYIFYKRYSFNVVVIQKADHPNIINDDIFVKNLLRFEPDGIVLKIERNVPSGKEPNSEGGSSKHPFRLEA